MAYEALNEGGTSTAILNAANEIAVDAFLNKKLSFTNISKVIEKTLENTTKVEADSLQTILQADSDARHVSADWVNKLEFNL